MELWNTCCWCTWWQRYIHMHCPSGKVTLFHNYKGFFSLVLLALYDAKYYFHLVDTGQHGSNNDSSMLNYSEIEINLLPAKNLKSCSFELLPSDMIEDEICLLKAWLMHAHPDRLAEEQLVFCYWQSRVGRVIENAFGILVSRWRNLIPQYRLLKTWKNMFGQR